MTRGSSQRLTSTGGEKVELAGHTVAQVRFASGGSAARLILTGDGVYPADLAIEEVVTLTRDYDQVVLNGARPGTSYNPRELAPLLDLLGERVEQVRVEPGGALTLKFYNGWTLGVAVSECGEPGWQLRSGRCVTLI